jgi:NAD(P)-dependent dehydrogenase (short-subunit alcohol dehydrogenase family)
VTEDHFDRHFDINVKGMVFTVQKALPLAGQGASTIVTASISGIKGQAGLGIYSATKAAIRNLVRTWALDLKGSGDSRERDKPRYDRNPGP